MASMQPYSQLTGPLKAYLAPHGEAEPDVNSTPGGNWVEVGPTDGEQSIEETGDLTKFYDNDHIGPVKGTRTRTKDGRPGVECVFHALEDDNQTEDNRLGWDTVRY